MIKLVIRNLVITGLLILGFVLVYDKITRGKTDQARWDTSPCGTKLFSGKYVLGYYSSPRETDPTAYKDDGVHIWRIKSLQFKNFNPHIKTAQLPEVEWEMAMERTPQACKAWIERTGINLAKK